MILTESQIKQIVSLKSKQWGNVKAGRMIRLSHEEYVERSKDMSEMTLEKYLCLSDEEQRKWYINAKPMEPELIDVDPQTGEEIYRTGFYFEPWSSSLLEWEY